MLQALEYDERNEVESRLLLTEEANLLAYAQVQYRASLCMRCFVETDMFWMEGHLKPLIRSTAHRESHCVRWIA